MLTPDAIVLNKNEGRGFTLYLPGYLKLEDMKFGLADGVTFSWNGQEIRPGDSAEIHDREYQYKDGTYYVKGVKTEFSAEGGVRTVELGYRLR